MKNEIFLRPIIFIFAAVLHLFIIFFMVVNIEKLVSGEPENVRVMKLTDIN